MVNCVQYDHAQEGTRRDGGNGYTGRRLSL
jgi:hypothetical protein